MIFCGESDGGFITEDFVCKFYFMTTEEVKSQTNFRKNSRNREKRGEVNLACVV